MQTVSTTNPDLAVAFSDRLTAQRAEIACAFAPFTVPAPAGSNRAALRRLAGT